MQLAGCSGGSGPQALPTTSPDSTLQYSWQLAGSNQTFASTPILFTPWVGTWPNVAVSTAVVTVENAAPEAAVSLLPTAACVSVSNKAAAQFNVQQGNNGRCTLIASDGARFVPIIADDGYPEGVPFRINNGASAVTAPLSLSVGQQLHLSVALTILPSRHAPNPYYVAVFGGCVSTPSTLNSSTNPIDLTITGLSSGSCVVVVSDGETGSENISLSVT
jgi:hypothetical protein